MKKFVLLLAVSASGASAQAQNALPETAPVPEPAPIAPSEISPNKSSRRTLRLRHVKPSLMAYWLDPAHNPRPEGALPLGGGTATGKVGLPGDIQQILSVDTQNVLLVAGGTDEDIRHLQELIDVLDQPLRVALTHATAPRIEAFSLAESALKTVLPDFDLSTQDGKPRFLTSDEATRLLGVAPGTITFQIIQPLESLEPPAPQMPNLADGAAPPLPMPNLAKVQPMTPLMAPMPGSLAVPFTAEIPRPVVPPNLAQAPDFKYQSAIAFDQSVIFTFGTASQITVPTGQSATIFLPAQSTTVNGEKRLAFVRVTAFSATIIERIEPGNAILGFPKIPAPAPKSIVPAPRFDIAPVLP